MCKIIYDFIKCANHNEGYGYFEGNMTAVRYAQTISKSQRRKYNLYGIIPAAFFHYLENIEAIKQDKFVPDKCRTVGLLLDRLWETPKEISRTVLKANVSA